MACLKLLKLHQFRNFNEYELKFNKGVNLIIGKNGSGKTSILEAIHFLAHGRSFRAKELNRMIHQGQSQFTLFAETSDQDDTFVMAMQRSLRGDNKNRLNHVDVKSASQFAERLPILLFNPESFELLTGGSKNRRQMMDWGVFYHHPHLRTHFINVKRALKQRNAGLKQNLKRDQIKLWEITMFESIKAIREARANYLNQLFEATNKLLKEFMNQHDLHFRYDQGWPEDENLEDLWERSFYQDLRFGSTQYGPHHADLKIISHKKPAKDLLSRGQQKLLITMLKLAQGKLLHEQLKKTPIYLLDDLASELDQQAQEFLWNYLSSQQAQVILTSIEAKYFNKVDNINTIHL